MATTQNTYTGDNSTVSYSFTFPYLEETDIKVSLDGVITTAYTLSNATTVTFDTAPGTGVAIRIYRDTNNDTLAATFFAGSAIRAQDLNDDFLQNAYVTQEIKNRYLDRSNGGTITGDVTLTGDFDVTGDFDITGASSFTGNVGITGTLDMNANRILDVGTPTAGTDATNKTYVDTQDALRVAKAGDTMTGNLAMSNNRVTGLGTPSATTDAANKAYVDANILTGYQGPQASDPTTRTGGGALEEGDLYFNTVENVLKAYTGTEWVVSAAAGQIVRWRVTAAGGETELSGNDDDGNALSYVVGNEQVFLNGALQQRGVDYTATTGTSITGLIALTAGDIVELHAVQGYTSGTVTDGSITSAKIANDTIVNEDINSSAAIAYSKLNLTDSVDNDDVATSAGIVATKLSFTQSGTGATARTIDSKLKDVVSVKDFGAVGDGTTDDTAAIQAAVDYAGTIATALLTGSGVGVYFPPGIYQIGSTIEIPSDTDGIGFYGTPSKGSIIRTSADITMFMVGEDLSGGGDTSTSNPTYFTSFSNLMLISTGTTDNAVAIQLNRCPGTRISQCQFHGFWKALVGHRWNQSTMSNVTFYTSSGRTNSESFVELNGVYDSTNSHTPGGGQHWTDIEFLGTQANPINYGVRVNAVDGLYITQSHFGGCTTATLAVLPDGSAQNDTITDIKVDNCYFDNAIADNYHVLLGGTVDSDSMYQRINFSQTLFRGTGGNSTNCVRIDVTDDSGFVSSGNLFKDITFDQCEFTQAAEVGLVAFGTTASRVEVTNLSVSDSVFSLNNYDNDSSLIGSGIRAEVNGLTVTNNTFLADQNAAATVLNWNLSGASTTNTSVTVTGNTFANANCTEVSPYRTSISKHLRMRISHNTMPQKGTTISESYTTTTSGYAGGTPFIGTFDLGTTEQVAMIEARIVGVSTDGSDNHVAREHRTVFKTGSGGTISRVADNLIRNANTLSSNSYPTVVIPLNANGNAWAATTAYAAGDYVTASSNVYLCVTAGTSGATAPTHTSGAALNGTARFVYVAASDNNQFAVFVSGDSGVDLDWTADIKLVTAN